MVYLSRIYTKSGDQGETGLGNRVAAREIGPGVIDGKDDWVERLPITAKRTVHAKNEIPEFLVHGQRTTGRTILVQISGSRIDDLSGIQTLTWCNIRAGSGRERGGATLERNDLLLLPKTRRICGLRMTKCRIDRLMEQIWFAPIPHDRAEKSQIGRG